MNSPVDALFHSKPDIGGDTDIHAHTDADEQGHDQVDQSGVRTHGGHRLGTGEAAYHRSIRHIEKLLKNTAQGKRQGKKDDLAR